MTGEVAFGHEVSDDGLGHRRRRRGEEHAPHALEGGDLGLRYHEVCQPDTGKQHLAEGARVQHATVTVQARQGGQRTAHVAVLAVVIVFHHPGLVPGAHSSSSSRRGRLIVTPSGIWWEGVT